MNRNLKNIFFNKRTLVLAFFIILFPVIILFTKGHFSKPKLFNSAHHVPLLREQPKDTEVAKLPIPIHHWQTSQNTPVYFVPTEGLPIVDIIVSFDAGSARDGERFGLASLVARLLDKGTIHYSAENIAKSFENKGVQLKVGANRDKIALSLRFLNDDPETVSKTIALFSEILAKPQFPESFITQLKNQTLVTLKKELQQPAMIANRAFYKNVYGNHPYGHLVVGSLESVPRITKTDLLNFHKKYFVAQNATITIVGGIHRDLAQEISNTLTTSLPQGEKAESLPVVKPLKSGANVRVAYDSQQTHVIMGQPCCTIKDPDFYPLSVGNAILGEGILVSRLFKEIRDDRGLAYTVNSQLDFLEQEGPFSVVLQTKRDKALEATQLMKEVLTRFVELGPEEKEVIAAKKSIIGGFPMTIANNALIAGAVSEMTFYGLPINYLETYRSEIEKVTPEAVKNVFKKRLSPNNMVLVVVGE